ncbi:conserved hypothetical protein [Marinoscillum sp. 108]|nr:conserved hypothetical protein [Marinoscillum sp. 108]
MVSLRILADRYTSSPTETKLMKIEEAFEEIIKYSHYWNWAPDWGVVIDIYKTFPNSYSVLSPFAYSYLEELIRSTTSEYPLQFQNEDQLVLKKKKVGMSLISLAISESKEKNPEYAIILEELKEYYYPSKITDEGDKRHSVAHGYIHPRFWSQESFEKLILDIAKLSKYAGF